MDKRKNLIERFLENYKMEGVCDFVVTEDYDGTGNPSVYIVLDSEWINSVPTNPDFIVRRMRAKLREDIDNWLGVEVDYVGSYVKKCDETTDLLENISPMIRRRMNVSMLPSVVEVVVEHFFPYPCEFSSYEFVENVASKISDIIVHNVGKNVTVGEQNSLTVYLINEFADHLRDYHKTKCSGSLQSNESLMENVSPEVRRRIDSENLNDLIDDIIEYELNACEYPVGEFVAEACDLAVNNIVDYVVNNTSLQKVTFKDRDSLYYFFVDTFGDYLSNYHRKTCGKLKESKKKIVVTESQYKRLFEQKINLYSEDKNHIKKLEMFQNLIDKCLDYISRFCDYSLSAEEYAGDISFDSCDSLASIDGIKVDKLVFGQVGGSNSPNQVTNSLTFVHLYLTINYYTIGTITDFDDILYDIKTFLRNKTGLHIIFTYTTHNLNTNKQW